MCITEDPGKFDPGSSESGHLEGGWPQFSIRARAWRTRGSEEVVGKTHIIRVLLSFLINLYLLLLDCQEKKKKKPHKNQAQVDLRFIICSLQVEFLYFEDFCPLSDS